MLKFQCVLALVFATALSVIPDCAGNASMQKSRSGSISLEDLLRIFSDQPDHTADRTIEVNGSVTRMKFAKKHNKVRQEFYPLDSSDSLKAESFRQYKIVTIGEVGQPFIGLDPQERTFAEAPENGLSSFNIEDFLSKASAGLGQIKAEYAGAETVGGQKATRIRVKFGDGAEEMYFSFADDLKNLFLKMDSGTIKQLKGTYTVSNVSLDVPDEIFQIPNDYRKVDFTSMLSTIKQKALK